MEEDRQEKKKEMEEKWYKVKSYLLKETSYVKAFSEKDAIDKAVRGEDIECENEYAVLIVPLKANLVDNERKEKELDEKLKKEFFRRLKDD